MKTQKGNIGTVLLFILPRRSIGVGRQRHASAALILG
jgi:hypothetical protein